MVINKNLSIDSLGIRNLVTFIKNNYAKSTTFNSDRLEGTRKENEGITPVMSDKAWNDIKEMTIALIKNPIDSNSYGQEEKSEKKDNGYADYEKEYLLTGNATAGLQYRINDKGEREYGIVNIMNNPDNYTSVLLCDSGIICKTDNGKNGLAAKWSVAFQSDEERNRAIAFFQKIPEIISDSIDLPFTGEKGFWSKLLAGETDGAEQLNSCKTDNFNDNPVYTMVNEDEKLELSVYQKGTQYSVSIKYEGVEMSVRNINPEDVNLTACSYEEFVVWYISKYGSGMAESKQNIFAWIIDNNDGQAKNYIKRIKELMEQNIGNENYNQLEDFLKSLEA